MSNITKEITLTITLPITSEITEDDLELDFESYQGVEAIASAIDLDGFEIKAEFLEAIKIRAAADRAEGMAWAERR